MKRRFKGQKMLLLMLVAIMLTVAGCGQKTEEPVKATPAGTAQGEGTKPAEPPVELTMSAPPFSQSFPPGFQDDPVMKEIEKKLNIKLNIIPANAVGDVSAKFAAQLASGDLPDIASIPSAEMYKKIISAKAALPLDDYLEKYGQHIVKEIPQRVEYSRKFMSTDVDGNNDGKLYILNTGGDSASDPLEVQAAPNLRYDLWKKLGFPKLETMDDYLPVLKQMMELEPVNSDGKKNYGVSGWFADSWGDWPFQTVFGMMEGKSFVRNWGVLDMESNELTPLLTDPDSYFWKGITWFNKAYRLGILDPDSFTMKWDNYLEKLNSNRNLLSWTANEGGTQAFIQGGTPEKGYFQMPAPNNLDKYIVSFAAPLGMYSFMISKNTKHPEKAVELLDFLLSYEGTRLIVNGVEGVHWDEVDGKPVFKQEVLDGLKNDTDYRIKSGLNKYNNLAGRGYDIVDPRFNIPLYFMFQPQYVKERMSAVQKEGVEHFGVELPGDLITKTKKYKYFDTSVAANYPPPTEDIKLIETKLANFIKTNQYKMIALKTEAEFTEQKAKFIAEVQKLGADQVYQWYKDEIAKAK
ncbi:extracellular solute-binding protein [Paenibacillus eucommiae]|uniref:ABC-type glycerol-3-phosphate transport system substrate-binding protein n=1 Tax=Paenibacillus eucommiae TaxID=1355755 RepID=A0ABS4JAB8_9BACL|nr:extracellular solute-binding protein [Paenibacillus eucommiae]MBP1996041.1 ABC-type glycerol-3-phosphate transport system substrate-binding protein [Paenibacillus eucommiae]